MNRFDPILLARPWAVIPRRMANFDYQANKSLRAAAPAAPVGGIPHPKTGGSQGQPLPPNTPFINPGTVILPGFPI